MSKTSMSGADFSAWLAYMLATKDWTGARCAVELECGVNSVSRWKVRGAPRYIALACQALAHDIPAWPRYYPDA